MVSVENVKLIFKLVFTQARTPFKTDNLRKN